MIHGLDITVPLGLARLIPEERLRPVLAARWASPGIEPVFAAPFFAVVPYDWDRYVP